jgi:RNA polymerase sigma-70 factor (ECF subfamily)
MLFDVLLGARPPHSTTSSAPREELERLVDERVQAAMARWPDLTPTAEEFAAYVGAHLPPEAELVDALVELHADDLYLACACARGDGRAVAAFDAQMLGPVPAYVSRIDGSRAFADEVRQRVRARLLVADAGPPKIVDYTGRGPLGGWVRVAVVREALNAKRGTQAQREESTGGADEERFGIAAGDPELDYLKTRYAGELREAFVATLAALPTDERNVLRMHYLDGLSIDEIGIAYHVHRSTAARWITRARETLLLQTRARLSTMLAAAPSEVESLLALVQSQLDVSLRRILE